MKLLRKNIFIVASALADICFPPAWTRLSVFLVLIAVSTQNIYADFDPDAPYKSANEDFAKKDFADASKKYNQLVEGGHFSKDLFFNLGTAEYRSGSYGEGVLWFRRALVLNPGMPEVEQNMKFLRIKTGLLEFTESTPDRMLLRTSPALLRWLISLGFWIAAFALAALFCIRRLKKFRGLLIASTIAGFLLAGLSIFASSYRARNLAIENYATVIHDKTKAVTAPTPDAKDVINLPPGSEVRIIQDADRWTYVEIPGELRGWVRSDDLKAVWPIPQSTKQ